jgi:hypothetical protein
MECETTIYKQNKKELNKSKEAKTQKEICVDVIVQFRKIFEHCFALIQIWVALLNTFIFARFTY